MSTIPKLDSAKWERFVQATRRLKAANEESKAANEGYQEAVATLNAAAIEPVPEVAPRDLMKDFDLPVKAKKDA